MGETRVYQTNLQYQTCTCPAGQYGRWCKHLTALVDAQRVDGELVAEAQQRWARECAVQARARAAEIARNPWHTYPGSD